MKKTFECVEMKNRLQKQLRMEYEQNKQKYSSYADFINATAQDIEEIKEFRKKIALANQPIYSNFTK